MNAFKQKKKKQKVPLKHGNVTPRITPKSRLADQKSKVC